VFSDEFPFSFPLAENVLYNENTKEIHLIDFSEARIFHTASKLNDKLIGTPAFSSPEQSGRLNRPIDFRSDLYNVGVMFYLMLTGSLPFKHHGGNLLDLVHAHMSMEVPKVRSARADVPAVLGRVVEKLLQKDPDDRFQSACGLWKHLMAIRRGLEVEPPRLNSLLDMALVKMSQILQIGGKECY